MPETVLKKFGKYEILTELGRGGMGVVYMARDPLIGRLVALKTLSPDVLSDPHLLKRFYREAQSAGNLQHPNVVTIYDLGEVSGSPYIAMELVEGETLQEIIARQPPMPLPQKLNIIRQFCRGLGHAHRYGVTHRDVKPANILVKRDGTTKVVDFGIAHLEMTSMTKSGTFIGTVYYASPEQTNNTKVDSRSDIFAVGVVIYEFLAYVRPFNGPTVVAIINQVLSKDPAPLRQLVPDIPAELETIVSRCLRKDPDERYQTLEEMLLELDPVAENLQQDFAEYIISQVPELIARRDFSRARELLLNVLTIDHSHNAAKNLLMEVNSGIRRQEVSTKIADCLNRGQESFQKGDYEGAVHSFEEVLRLDSKHDQAHALLVTARRELERAEEVRKRLVPGKNAYRSGDLTDAEVWRRTTGPQTSARRWQLVNTTSRKSRVLVVDDDKSICLLLDAKLKSDGYESRYCTSGSEALKLLSRDPFDAIISDLKMPEVTGFDLLEAAGQHLPHAAFLMATAVDDIGVGIAAMKKGAADYLLKPLQLDAVIASLERALGIKGLEAELQNYREHMEEMVDQRTEQLEAALRRVELTYDETLEVLAAALDLRDYETAGHSRRVTLYALEIAKVMRCSEELRKQLTRGGFLHDIGKIGIPDSILLKGGKLTPEERAVMQTHVLVGCTLMGRVAFLAPAAEIALAHHERFDGTGYPQGLAGDAIPLGARIFAVADTLDAMMSDRPYRRAQPFTVAHKEIQKESGKQFDPQVVEAFLSIGEETWERIRREAAKTQPDVQGVSATAMRAAQTSSG